MIRLKPTSAFAQLQLPATLTDCTLRALPVARITAIAPLPGQDAALRRHLAGLPAPGEVLTSGNTRLVWAGRDLSFAFGDDLPDGLGACCALSDQSDGWCGLGLHGRGAAACLGRRLPFDLRNMANPGAARSVMDHIPVLIIRAGKEDFEIWVWRSMVQSAMAALMP